LFLFIALSLLPLLSSGFYSDDITDSIVKSRLSLKGVSLGEHLVYRAQIWLRNGRVMPLGHQFISTIAWLFPQAFTAKVFILCLILLNVALFGALVFKLTGNRDAALLSMAVVPVFFQFRIYHDPILSFYGFQQYLWTLILLSLWLLVEYVNRGKLIRLLASVGFFNLALYSYEIGFVFVVAIVFIVADHYNYSDVRSIAVKASPYLLSVFLYLWTVAVIRIVLPATHQNYTGVKASFDFLLVFKTFLAQFSAALPLSYFFFNPSFLFSHDAWSVVRGIEFLDLILCAFMLTVVIANFRFGVNRKIAFKLSMLGLSTWVLLSLVISFSQKYQQELSGSLGLGYIPVYIEYFFALLFFLGVYSLIMGWIGHRGLKFLINGVLLAALSTGLLVNLQNNRKVIAASNAETHYKMVAVENALRSGLLAPVPEGSKLFVVDTSRCDLYPYVKPELTYWSQLQWNSIQRDLYHKYSGKKFDVYLKKSEVEKGLRADPKNFDRFYLLEIYSDELLPKERPAALRLTKFRPRVLNRFGISLGTKAPKKP